MKTTYHTRMFDNVRQQRTKATYWLYPLLFLYQRRAHSSIFEREHFQATANNCNIDCPLFAFDENFVNTSSCATSPILWICGITSQVLALTLLFPNLSHVSTTFRTSWKAFELVKRSLSSDTVEGQDFQTPPLSSDRPDVIRLCIR